MTGSAIFQINYYYQSMKGGNDEEKEIKKINIFFSFIGGGKISFSSIISR